MLNNKIIKKIEDFVYSKPRSIQEIAQHLNKNWRTIDRYVQQIKKEFGTIDTRTFREGTRGALKIVYWASINKISHSIFQEQLETEIFSGRSKYDFNPFDIFQHVKENKKTVWTGKGKNEVEVGRLEGFRDLLLEAKKQILFFSGNLSFINFKNNKVDIFKILEELVKKGINIKVVCRIDLVGKENIERLLSLNHKYGKEFIQIHHRVQPLRVTVVDDKLINMKEIKEPTGREKELDKKTFIFYTIKDKEWVEWMTKIFWKMYSNSIDSSKRIEELNKIF